MYSQVALAYPGVESNFEVLNSIDWPGTNAPVNIPECGYMNEFCPGETDTNPSAVVFINVWV